MPNYIGQSLVNLCGAPGNCPAGFSTGEPISPAQSGGYGGGGGLQRLTSVVIDQAGNVWVVNNNILTKVCFGKEGVTPPNGITDVQTEALSTQCGGNGVVVFYGIAAPVAAPLIGPPRQP